MSNQQEPTEEETKRNDESVSKETDRSPTPCGKRHEQLDEKRKETKFTNEGNDSNLDQLSSKSPLFVINISAPSESETQLNRHAVNLERGRGRSRRRRENKRRHCNNPSTKCNDELATATVCNKADVRVMLRRILAQYCPCISESVVQYFEKLIQNNETLSGERSRTKSLDRQNQCPCLVRCYEQQKRQSKRDIPYCYGGPEPITQEGSFIMADTHLPRCLYRQIFSGESFDGNKTVDRKPTQRRSDPRTSEDVRGATRSKLDNRKETSLNQDENVAYTSPWNELQKYGDKFSDSECNMPQPVISWLSKFADSNEEEVKRPFRNEVSFANKHWKEEAYNSKRKGKDLSKRHQRTVVRSKGKPRGVEKPDEFELFKEFHITKRYQSNSQEIISKENNKVTVISRKNIRNITIDCKMADAQMPCIRGDKDTVAIPTNATVRNYQEHDRDRVRKLGIASVKMIPCIEQEEPLGDIRETQDKKDRKEPVDESDGLGKDGKQEKKQTRRVSRSDRTENERTRKSSRKQRVSKTESFSSLAMNDLDQVQTATKPRKRKSSRRLNELENSDNMKKEANTPQITEEKTNRIDENKKDKLSKKKRTSKTNIKTPLKDEYLLDGSEALGANIDISVKELVESEIGEERTSVLGDNKHTVLDINTKECKSLDKINSIDYLCDEVIEAGVDGKDSEVRSYISGRGERLSTIHSMSHALIPEEQSDASDQNTCLERSELHNENMNSVTDQKEDRGNNSLKSIKTNKEATVQEKVLKRGSDDNDCLDAAADDNGDNGGMKRWDHLREENDEEGSASEVSKGACAKSEEKRIVLETSVNQESEVIPGRSFEVNEITEARTAIKKGENVDGENVDRVERRMYKGENKDNQEIIASSYTSPTTRKPIILDPDTSPPIVLSTPSVAEEDLQNKAEKTTVKEKIEQDNEEEVSDEEKKISIIKNLFRRKLEKRAERSGETRSAFSILNISKGLNMQAKEQQGLTGKEEKKERKRGLLEEKKEIITDSNNNSNKPIAAKSHLDVDRETCEEESTTTEADSCSETEEESEENDKGSHTELSYESGDEEVEEEEDDEDEEEMEEEEDDDELSEASGSTEEISSGSVKGRRQDSDSYDSEDSLETVDEESDDDDDDDNDDDDNDGGRQEKKFQK